MEFIAVMLAAAILLAAFAAAGFAVHAALPQTILRNSLAFQPLLVRIPASNKTGAPEEGVREFGLAAELFSVLAGIRVPFSVEISVSHVGTAPRCYVAVPRNAARFAEESIKKFWPDARVRTVHEDLIFHSGGAVAAATLKKKIAANGMLHTYATLKTNSCLPVVRAFEDIHEVGEGLALQILVKPAPSHAIRLSSKLLEREERKKAIFGQKKQYSFFSVNIRLVASAPSPLRADELLGRLGRAFNHFETPEGQGLRAAKAPRAHATVRRFLDRAFDEKESVILSGDELVSIIHLPTCAM